MTLEELKTAILGTWVSVAPEVRPSKNPDGTLKPFYLTRRFVYLPEDRFELNVVNYADPFGHAALAKIEIAGHMFWRGDHPIAAGAQKVDFVADEAYAVTPMHQGFADVLGKVAAEGYAPWQVGQKQSIFGKSFRPFGLEPWRDLQGIRFAALRARPRLLGGAEHRRPRLRHRGEPANKPADSARSRRG